MKKTVRLTPSVIVTVVLVVFAIIATLLVSQGVFASKADENPSEGITLRVGKYMHISGDETKYVEVFENKTVQVFGRNLFEETVNLPENKETYETITDEEREEVFRELQELSDWYDSKHEYDIVAFSESFGFVRFDGSAFGINVTDERTLSINDDNVYVYAG